MEPVTVVVGDVHRDASPELSVVRKSDSVDNVGLQRVEEGLGMSIVARRAAARHALLKAETPETFTKESAAMLTAAVAMEDEPLGWMAAPQSKIEGRSSQGAAAAACHAPSDN